MLASGFRPRGIPGEGGWQDAVDALTQRHKETLARLPEVDPPQPETPKGPSTLGRLAAWATEFRDKHTRPTAYGYMQPDGRVVSPNEDGSEPIYDGRTMIMHVLSNEPQEGHGGKHRSRRNQQPDAGIDIIDSDSPYHRDK